MKSSYAVLGVDRTASKDQIKAAYRRLIKKHHPDRPDRAPGDAAMCVELNLAYEQLMDESKRRQHDAALDASEKRTGRTEKGLRIIHPSHIGIQTYNRIREMV